MEDKKRESMKKKFRKALFIVVYTLKDNSPEYLILKRKLHWVGWEFPKGGIESQESKRKALIRETKEETGLTPIKIKKHKYSGKYIYPKILKDRLGFIGQTFELYSTEVKKEKVKLDKKEHSGHKWLNYSKAYKMLKHKNQKKALKIVNTYLSSKLK